jgi:hypothetical protein
MSLFFEGERKPKPVAVEVPRDLPADYEAAVECVSRKYDLHVIADHGHISVEQARDLLQTCRRMEPLLLAALQNGTVTTQTSASTFIRDNTDGFFPVAKYIARMKVIVGFEAKPPVPSATWAQVLAAAQTEDVESGK